MVRGSNFKSFCMVALLVAEAIQEVCLALASQLTVNEAGNSHKSQHVPFDLDLLSGRAGSSYASDPVPCSSALIHSLCRMTC
jgi:hypothetical protein